MVPIPYTESKYKTAKGELIKKTPFISSKNMADHSCKPPLCASCQLSNGDLFGAPPDIACNQIEMAIYTGI